MSDFIETIREHVRERGDEPAFTFVSEAEGPGRAYREEVLGYAELDRRARALATWLQSHGMQDRAVLLLYPEGLHFIAAFLGCLYARAIAVPSPMPWQGSTRLQRTERIIRDADIGLILTDSANRAAVDAWLGERDLEGSVECLPTDADLADPGDWSRPRVAPGTLALLQYTSGSTSDPKGVMVTHGNLLHNQQDIQRCCSTSPDTVAVGWIPHYHDMGLIGLILQPLYTGGRSVITSPLTFLMNPAVWLEMITRHRGTQVVAPNFGYELCVRRVRDEQLEGLDLSALRSALTGAEPIRAGTLERMEKRFAKAGFRPDVWLPCYGMAETTLMVTGARAGDGALIREFDREALALNRAVTAAEGGGRRLVSSGRPISLDVRIVDPATRAELPPGRVGEIWVRGGSVALGYWGRPAETREAFRAVTAEGHGPYLRTGDLGFLADGELYVTGRLKDMIVVNGRNVYAHDIEEAARDMHPAARTAAAFALNTGREQVVVVQEISKSAANGTRLSELAARTRDRLAREFGLPALSVVLSERGSVRRTTSGKVQRRLTRQAFLDGEIAELASDLDPDVATLRLAEV